MTKDESGEQYTARKSRHRMFDISYGIGGIKAEKKKLSMELYYTFSSQHALQKKSNMKILKR